MFITLSRLKSRSSNCALLLLLCASLSSDGLAASSAERLHIVNPLDADRGDEVLEIPIAEVLSHTHLSQKQLDHIVVHDAKTDAALPVQLFASMYGKAPDTLLVLTHLRAQGSQDLVFRTEAAPAGFPARVFGREAPERKDDFAWENELVTYRVYGPALQATGEITSGIDVWSKRVPNFVIDSFYKRDAEGARTHNPGLSYHKDNGIGLDSYYVGPTRGCGGTAVFKDGQLFVSKNYTTNRIIANGPIRFAFDLAYATWDAGGVQVAETKRIILDAGTHLNRITSTYTFEGGGKLYLAAGLAIHSGAQAEIPVQNQIAAVWDTPQDLTAGRIATGVIALPSEHAQTKMAANHVLLVFERESGKPFTYYTGAGWSKADIKSPAEWSAYLQGELQRRLHPLIHSWVGNSH